MKRKILIPNGPELDAEAVEVEVEWTCPVCGGPRGEPARVAGFVKHPVDAWHNPCDHIDFYDAVLAEAGEPA